MKAFYLLHGIYLCVCVCARVPLWLDYMRRDIQGQQDWKWIFLPRCHGCCQGARPAATSLESGAGEYCQDVSRKLFPCPLPFHVEACSTWPPSSPLTSSHGEKGTPLMVGVGGSPVCLQGMCVLVCFQPHLAILSCRELAVSSTPCARWVSLISGWSVVD